MTGEMREKRERREKKSKKGVGIFGNSLFKNDIS